MDTLTVWSAELRRGSPGAAIETAVRAGVLGPRLMRQPGDTVTSVARDLGVSYEGLRRYVHQADVDAGETAGLTIDERAELVRLRRENRTLRMEREILKKAAVFFAVTCPCRTLGVSPSGYWAWIKRPPSARTLADEILTVVDVFSRMVVGWAMAGHLRTELIDQAIDMAVMRRRPEAGLIHHSDRGTQQLATSPVARAVSHGPPTDEVTQDILDALPAHGRSIDSR